MRYDVAGVVSEDAFLHRRNELLLRLDVAADGLFDDPRTVSPERLGEGGNLLAQVLGDAGGNRDCFHQGDLLINHQASMHRSTSHTKYCRRAAIARSSRAEQSATGSPGLVNRSILVAASVQASDLCSSEDYYAPTHPAVPTA